MIEPTNLREQLARRLWDRGFGADPAVRVNDFMSYLAGIPQIHEGLVADDPDLRFLSLCDPRPGLTRACKLLDVRFEELGYSDASAEPFDERFALPSGPFWFRHDDGRKKRRCRPDRCREESTDIILAGSAMEGLFAYAHHPDIVVEGRHSIDLPATVHCSARTGCSYLWILGGQCKLGLLGFSQLASSIHGTMRVRRS